MGKLAQVGIAFGRKVPVQGLIGLQKHLRLDDFSLGCLSSRGCRSIVAKVVDGKELSPDEISFLLSDVSFPALLKLIELRPAPSNRVTPSPLVSLPLSAWLQRQGFNRGREQTLSYLQRIPHRPTQVVLDKIDLARREAGILDLVNEMACFRRDLSLVGPTPREIFSWISASNPGIRTGRLYVMFEQLITQLHEAGVYRLQACTSHETLLLVHAVGFPNCLVTDLSRFNTPDLLANELCRINDLSGPDRIIDVWVPATGSPGQAGTASSALHDLRILRALAVGSICLNNISHRRASSRRLSLEGMNFSQHCGANDFGFGAIDAETCQSLKLQPLDKLMQAVG